MAVIRNSARKHRVGDDDMLHALRHAIRYFDLDEGFLMIVGPDRAGELIEVGVTRSEGVVTIVHAMSPARPGFRRFVR